MSVAIAYLSRGKLFVRDAQGNTRSFDSRFGQQVRDRAVRRVEHNAWKTNGTGARFMGLSAWGMGERDPAAIRIAITGVGLAAQAGQLLYTLATDDIVGVFAFDPSTGEERRLYHSNSAQVQFPSSSPGRERAVCAVRGPAGTSHLGIMRSDGSDLREITEGETLDQAPSWVPGKEEVVFHSAGIGRDREGQFMGYGPSSIQRLDLATSIMTTLVEDERFDHLVPRVAEDGALYFIRRPHKDPTATSPFRFLLDVLLFPFRLLVSVFHFLNIFSMRYSGKPLTSSGGAQQKPADPRQMMILGNLVDAERARRAAQRRGEKAPALVPASWKLMRQRDGQAPEEIASAVLSFDICPDGTIVYSNGSVIERLSPDGKRETVCKDEVIEQVVALG